MNSTEKRILAFFFLILIFLAAVIGIYPLSSFRQMYRQELIQRSNGLAAGLKAFAEAALHRNPSLEELDEVGQSCRQIAHDDPNITYCLVENALGVPLFSSDPDFAILPVADVFALSTNTARFEIPRFGSVYEVSLPFYGEGKRLAGRVRIGFAEEVVTDAIRPLLQRFLLAATAVLLTAMVLMAFFIRRRVSGPIRRLCLAAKEIAAGNFQGGFPPVQCRDFADFTEVLQQMSQSLQVREKEVLDGYHQLEQTNRLLQQAYEQQEKTSNELSRNQKMHRALFENASDAILISDHEDNILLFNKRAEAFFRISRDQALGRNLLEFILQMGGDSSQLQEFHKILHAEGRGESELVFSRPGENQTLVGRVSASVIQERLGHFWSQVIFRDITSESRIKENLAQSARDLQRLNRMKDSFLGLASHELKTPLTVIVGYSDLLLQEALPSEAESARIMVSHIADAADRLSGIVYDMVDVSLLDRYRLPMEISEIEVNTLLQQVVTEVEHRLEHRRQKISLRLQGGLPKIHGDPKRLSQAFGNLLGNAIKFTPDGGCIHLESRLYEPGSDGEQRVEVLFGDNGIGIAENEIEQIFDKFYEIGDIEEHFTAKVAFRGKGTGLGLTIAKGIAEMHSGCIWVESAGYDPQKCPGSVFHVVLPLRPSLRRAA